jgi:hypothetical protein
MQLCALCRLYNGIDKKLSACSPIKKKIACYDFSGQVQPIKADSEFCPCFIAQGLIVTRLNIIHNIIET